MEGLVVVVCGGSVSGADLQDSHMERLATAASVARFLVHRYVRLSDSGCLSANMSTQRHLRGAGAGSVGCHLAGNGGDRIRRSRGTVELQLHTEPTSDAAEEELPPRSIHERRSASSSSSCADELEDSAASSQWMESE